MRNYMLGVLGSSEMHIQPQRIKAYIFLQRQALRLYLKLSAQHS